MVRQTSGIELGTSLISDRAIEVADLYPSAYIQGVDLYPPPETWVPPNCKFEVDDVLKPWTFLEKFDLIHLRHMIGSFTEKQWKGIYKQAYEFVSKVSCNINV